MKKVKNVSTDTKPVFNRRKCCYDSGEASRKSMAFSVVGKQGKLAGLIIPYLRWACPCYGEIPSSFINECGLK